MNIHKKTEELLYEYLRNELDAAGRTAVENHINSCHRCRAEMEQMKEIIFMIPASALDASKLRSEEYWNNFAVNVEHRLHENRPLPKRAPLSIGSMLDHLLFTPRPYITAFGSALAILLIVVGYWKWYDHKLDIQHQLTQRQAAESAQYDSTSEQVYQYVRQTKMLLVGIANMKPVEGTSYDVSVERQKSRELIHQARYLKDQPLDERTEKLIDDLQRILIELANLKEDGNAPNIEIIRSGVHQENLLFKIRMAEQTYGVKRDKERTSF